MCLFSNRSQKTSKCVENISDTLDYASWATFLFLPYFDIICDLLLNRSTATWNLFVNRVTRQINWGSPVGWEIIISIFEFNLVCSEADYLSLLIWQMWIILIVVILVIIAVIVSKCILVSSRLTLYACHCIYKSEMHWLHVFRCTV